MDQELEPLIMRLLGRQRGDRANHLIELEVDGLDVELIGLNLGEIEDVIDDAEERRAGVVDFAHVVPLLGIKGRLEGEVREADDGVHGRADLVAHVGQERALGLGGVVGFLHGQTELGLKPFELGNVLSHAVYVGRFSVGILHHLPQRMDPDHASIDRPPVRVCHVIHRDGAGDGGGEVLRRDLGGRFVACAGIRGPKVLLVTVPGTRRVSVDPGRTLGGIIPAGAVQRHVPVSGLGEFEGAVGEKVDAVELFGLILRLLELAAEQFVVAVDHQLKRCAACLQPLHLLLEGADFLLELTDVVGLHHAPPTRPPNSSVVNVSLW